MSALKKIVFLIIIACVCMQAQADPAPRSPFAFALNMYSLKNSKARINRSDPQILPAYKQLLTDAYKALQFGPVSVMEKKHLPPSGNKHDYMSLAPYHWPDPSK